MWSFQRIGLISNVKLKNYGIFLFLRPSSQEKIERLSKEFIKRIKFNNIYYTRFIPCCEDSNCKVSIVSASFHLYLQHIDSRAKIIATTISESEGKYQRIKKHVYGDAKKDSLVESNIDRIDEFYTDSSSDISIYLCSEKTFVVKKDNIIQTDGIDDFYTQTKIQTQTTTSLLKKIILSKYINF